MNANLKAAVSERYGEIARRGLSSDDEKTRDIARAFGYSESDLASIPAEANMGVSCGNPTAAASLAKGETVVDLGSGGGLDVFLAARQVGPTGKAIGIDMTEDMIALARRNARKMDLDNVTFHRAEIESMPLDDESVDCVISNCVLVLVPDKLAAFREIFRVLKPGGRLAVSDMALKRALPKELSVRFVPKGDVVEALTMSDYEKTLAAAGFAAVQVIDSESDLNVYRKAEALDQDSVSTSGVCGVGVTTVSALRLLGVDVNEYAASVKIFALK
jgi:ubiquinone/menaquinone biosynthesis C-methylase UbiE